MSEPSDLKTYKARCHCNATIFTVAIPPLETGATKVVQCNCSICTKRAYALVYPLREDVKFIKGENELKDYYFGSKTHPHRFCGECGTPVLVDLKNVVNYKPLVGKLGVTIRTFDGIEDLLSEDKISFIKHDGKRTMNPQYAPLADA